MSRVCWTVGAAAIAMSLGACGGSNSASEDDANAGQTAATASGAASGTDPCSLVTVEEVGAVVGEKIISKAASQGRCEYQTADAAASSVTIEINQSDAAGEMATAQQAAGVLKNVGAAVSGQGGAGADVNAALSESGDAPKIGDEAFFGPNQQLSVLKGSSYIAISPPMMRSRMAAGNPLLSAEDKKKMAIAIAEKAIARLP
jgi:hypothetical protein